MDKEYVEVLLKDMENSYSLEGKINLITVFISELAEDQLNKDKAILEIKNTFENIALFQNSVQESIRLIKERFEAIEKPLAEIGNIVHNLSVDAVAGATTQTTLLTSMHTLTVAVNKLIEDISVIKCKIP